jgi:hypothetical protein
VCVIGKLKANCITRPWTAGAQLAHIIIAHSRAERVLCAAGLPTPACRARERAVWPHHGWVWVMILTKAAATLLITTRGRNTNAHTQHRTMTKQSVHRTCCGQTFKKPFPKLNFPIHTGADALFSSSSVYWRDCHGVLI